MKRTKKWLSVLCAFALLAAVMAGCGGNATSNASDTAPAPSAAPGDNAPAAGDGAAAAKDMTLRVAWWGNQVRNDVTVAVLNMYSEQNPGVKFETEFTDWSGYWDKLATQAAAGSLPDIIQQDYSYFKQYQGKGQLLGLNQYIDSGALDISDCGIIIDSGRIDGELYAVPLGMNAPAMTYDKEAAAAAGVEIKNGITREELMEAADKIYAATGQKFDWGYGDGPNMIEYYVRGNGKVLFLDGKLGVDSPSELVGFYKIYEDGISSPAFMTAAEMTEAFGSGIELDPLSLGKSWMGLNYSNQYIAFANAAGKELGIVTWPVGAGDTTKAMFLKPSQFFSIASTSANPEEAARVVDFFTNSIEANKILNAERGIPIANKVAEALKAEADDANRIVFDYIAGIEPYCSQINPPNPEGMGEVVTLCNSMMEQVAYGQLTAEQAAEKFFNEANAILAKAAGA